MALFFYIPIYSIISVGRTTIFNFFLSIYLFIPLSSSLLPLFTTLLHTHLHTLLYPSNARHNTLAPQPITRIYFTLIYLVTFYLFTLLTQLLNLILFIYSIYSFYLSIHYSSHFILFFSVNNLFYLSILFIYFIYSVSIYLFILST